MIAGCFLSFTPCGIQLHTIDKLYRNYVSILGIKLGQWKSLKPYPYITLFGSRVSEKTYGASTPVSASTIEKIYNICLLTENHQEKIILKKCKTIEQAKSDLSDLSEKLGLQIVSLDP